LTKQAEILAKTLPDTVTPSTTSIQTTTPIPVQRSTSLFRDCSEMPLGTKDKTFKQPSSLFQSSTVDKFTSLLNLEQSTKMSALLQELHNIKAEDPTIKSIVFSQWTSMLDLLEKPLKAKGFQFVRLDGAMSQNHRQTAVDQFNTDPDVKVFLVSMKAGGLGLNLTGGSRVFLLDPWWNPAAEDQAIDRVHRIQQTREVVVYRFIIEGTIEERIRELQEKKRNLAQGALGEFKKDRKQLTMQELTILFQD